MVFLSNITRSLHFFFVSLPVGILEAQDSTSFYSYNLFFHICMIKSHNIIKTKLILAEVLLGHVVTENVSAIYSVHIILLVNHILQMLVF